MTELTITVIGRVGSGKSTIARIIQETLAAHGFKTSLQDDPVQGSQAYAVAALLKKPPFCIIKTEQEARAGL